MRNDCKLSEHNEAGDEEAIRRCNRSCVSGVGVTQPQSELYVRSRKWTFPLQKLPLDPIPQRCIHQMLDQKNGQHHLLSVEIEYYPFVADLSVAIDKLSQGLSVEAGISTNISKIKKVLTKLMLLNLMLSTPSPPREVKFP